MECAGKGEGSSEGRQAAFLHEEERAEEGRATREVPSPGRCRAWPPGSCVSEAAQEECIQRSPLRSLITACGRLSLLAVDGK